MTLRTGNTNAARRVEDTSPPPWWRWRTRSRAARCIRFVEEYLVVPKGHGAGLPVSLARFQKELLAELLDVEDVRSAVVSMPRGQGKSTLVAAVALWAVFDDEHSPQVPVVATTVQQAIRTVYSTAARMAEVSPELAGRSIPYSAIGATRLYVPYNNGTLLPLAADPDGLQGLDPSFAVVDEVGFVDQELWDAMVLASGKRPRSLVLGIGTPNVDLAGAMFELRKKHRAGVDLPGFRYIEFAADEGCDIGDRDQWRTANPALGAGFLAEDALEMAAATSPEASFRVFRLGQWVAGVQSWLGEHGRELWASLADPHDLAARSPTWLGVDIGLKRDSSAVVAAQRRPDGRIHVTARIWAPPDDGEGRLDVTDVMAHVRDLAARFDVQAVTYDPRFFDLAAQQLLDEGYAMVEFPQVLERMTPAVADTYDAIRRGELSHDSDPAFDAHVLAAQARFNERGFTLSKSRSRDRIDACVAMAMAVTAAVAMPAKPKRKPRIFTLAPLAQEATT
ncbi:MAG: hypothetical protein H0V19_03415 [Euzebyales bacterium]|nr:hypothetical protein [Euzebyales bacterium]